MDDTPIQVFIDNGATPSILPLSTYKKHPILQKYPTTKSTTPINTGGGTIELHFWIKLQLKLDDQTIQIKVLVCDSECPCDILLGRTSLAHLSALQDYANNTLYPANFPPHSSQKQCQNLTGKYRDYFGSIENRKNYLYP